MGILIVDDNKVNLFVIENILKRAGYKDYTSFLSAKEMFNYLKVDKPVHLAKPVDLILMDIMMPEMDGIKACKKLQSIPHLKEIPVVFVTALDDSDKVAEALDAGGVDYVMKPINKTELLARIRVGLRLKYEKDWHKEQDQKIKNELELSMQIQKSMLSEPVFSDNLTISASYLPAYKLAGDLYYWYKIDENRYAVILLDMMGHGISASLVCMFISSVLRDSINKYPDPEYVIKELNKWMNSLNLRNQQIPYYFTAIYMVIDSKQKFFEYVNAGHPSGFALIDENEIMELSSNARAVGLFEEIAVTKTKINYKENAQILLFTDGVFETIDKTGNTGLKQIKNAASSFWSLHSKPSPIDFILPLESQKDASDDMCAVVIQAGTTKKEVGT